MLKTHNSSDIKIRLLIILFFASLCDAANTSLTAGSGSGTLPTGAPWSNLAQISWQFRIHGSWDYSHNSAIQGTNAFSVRVISNGITITSWNYGSVGCSLLPSAIPTGTDVIVMAQQDAVTLNQINMWAFSTQTGQLITSQSCSLSGSGPSNDSGSSIGVGAMGAGSMAYIRTYTGLWTSNPAVPPVPGNTYNGTLLDYELENNGTDQTGHANLTMSGAAFGATPLYTVVACLNPWPNVNVMILPPGGGNGSISMDASCSFTATDLATLSYSHSQVSGPATGSFTNGTSAVATFHANAKTTSLSSGQDYVLKVHVVSSDSTANDAQVNVGAVLTKSDGTVDTGSFLTSAQAYLIGPVMPLTGTGSPMPWPWWDLETISVGRSIAASALANPPGLGSSLCTGSITSVTGTQPLTVVGSGTNFLSCLSGGLPVILAWNGPDGAGTGRHFDTVATITDNTHMTLSGTQLVPPGGWGSGLSIYAVPPVTSTFNMNWWSVLGDNGSNFQWCYYDCVAGYYRLYARTGLQEFLADARAFGDYNWNYKQDQGYAISYPRGMDILGMILRASDGHTERYPGVLNLVTYLTNSLHFWPPNFPSSDARETGYVQWFIAAGAMFDPDATRHGSYCGWLTTNAGGTGNWVSQLQTSGSNGWWPENIFAGNQGYVYVWTDWPTYPSNRFGASAWRSNIALHAAEMSYDVLNNAGDATCYNPTLAASLLTAITKVANANYNYGLDTNVSDGAGYRGTVYDFEYPSNAQFGCALAAPSCTGTASINNGSTSLAGSGTNFLTVSSGGGFIGLSGTGTTDHSMYKITSCASNTSCTITPAYGSFGETGNLSGAIWYWAPANTSSGCTQSTYALCPGDRNLNKEGISAQAWLYHTTGNTTYRDNALLMMGAMAGGPASGPNPSTSPGSFVTPGVGPFSDGFINDIIYNSLPCASNSAPCSPPGNPFGGSWKNAWQAMGANNADSVAWALIGTPTTTSKGLRSNRIIRSSQNK